MDVHIAEPTSSLVIIQAFQWVGLGQFYSVASYRAGH